MNVARHNGLWLRLWLFTSMYHRKSILAIRLLFDSLFYCSVSLFIIWFWNVFQVFRSFYTSTIIKQVNKHHTPDCTVFVLVLEQVAYYHHRHRRVIRNHYWVSGGRGNQAVFHPNGGVQLPEQPGMNCHGSYMEAPMTAVLKTWRMRRHWNPPPPGKMSEFPLSGCGGKLRELSWLPGSPILSWKLPDGIPSGAPHSLKRFPCLLTFHPIIG